MYHFTSAALMTPVKSHASFAASSLSSGTKLLTAEYGTVSRMRPPK